MNFVALSGARAASEVEGPTRHRFLMFAVAAAVALPRLARAQSDADPATNSARPALRVLLGHGDVQPASGGFTFNGRPYRGAFEHAPDGAIVNVVDLEQYLYAVVPHEMPPSWTPAALQAQAICARTYVLQRSNPQRAYDVVPSELDQVYGGMAGESPAARAAVDATAGQVLRYGAQFASVAYSSCCGGHTEASSDAWGGTFLPYLAGLPCPYCTLSPNYRWTATVPLDSIAQRLASRLSSTGTLQNLRIDTVDGSGRAKAIELDGDRGRVTIPGTAFRLTVGARVIRSLLLTSMQCDSGTVEIDGGGLGHGVGLCQWGAQGMGLTGRSATDILGFYFPGTQIVSD